MTIMRKIRVALVGNPNVGKSVIFNELTGGKAWIGNWPGVTVEKKVGTLKADEYEFEITDLPGIYSLTAYSIDEVIARNFIVEEKPDVVVNIVNAASIERNLYLTISLLEMEANVVIALNMMDIAESVGLKINVDLLSKKLCNIPIIPMIAIKKIGFKELIDAMINASKTKPKCEKIVDYGSIIEEQIDYVKEKLKEVKDIAEKYPLRWIAIKLLENDKEVVNKVRKFSEKLIAEVEEIRKKLSEKLGVDLEEYFVEKRYEKVAEIVKVAVIRVKEAGLTFSDIIDYTVTHKYLGIPIMMTVLYMLFKFAFDVATPFVDLIDILFNNILYNAVVNSGLPKLLASFLADGVISGLGSILVFLPNIALLFLALALLEDVGYMSRVAFITDKIMHKVGLTGKSIIPMVIGFGCNVPAIIATRVIEDENDRKTTALILPLMSCSARLPVYLVFAGTFFGAYAGAVVLSMYLLGLALAILIATFLRKFVFKGPSTGFIMEMPPYLIPQTRTVILKMWERTKKFLFKAGTVIFLGVITVWGLSITGPSGIIGVEALENPELFSRSWVGIIGHALSPIFTPMGWDWRATASLIFGLIAKELVVGVMAVLYGVSEENLSQAISVAFTPISAYAYMAFTLIYVPCLATIAAIRGELGVKYALIALAYELVLAYVVAFIIVSLGNLLGLG